MIESLPKDKFHELYMKLPEDLRDAIFAPETGETIEEICVRNKITGSMGFMINGIGDVYLGLLPPADFFSSLEKQLEGTTGIKQIILEIDKFLLFRHKDSLEKIYQSQPLPETPAAPGTTGPGEQNQPSV